MPEFLSSEDEVLAVECVGVDALESALVQVGATRVQRRAALGAVRRDIQRICAEVGGVPADARFLVQRCSCCGELSVDAGAFGPGRVPGRRLH